MSTATADRRLLVVAVLLLYLGGLVLCRDTVPPGLNNDAAEEALRGIELLDAGRFQVLSSSLGIPQETLYLYAVALVTRLLGTTTLAIQILAWTTALACLVMVVAAARRAAPELPAWIPLLLAASSLWLFHYGRAGVRAVSAPAFALAVGLLLDRVERLPSRRWPALACGAVLGLGLYAYTSCRALVVVFLLYAAIRLWRTRLPRRAAAMRYGLVLAAMAVISVPNLWFAAASPGAFLWRGAYVVRGGWREALGHIGASVLLPFGYAGRYRTLVGDAHIFDGVSAGLTGAGIDPIAPLLAAAWLIGLIAAWRRRREPIVLFLLLLWISGTLLLGFTGPSLTRLLLVLPAYLVIGALGLGMIPARWPRATPLVAAALAVAVAVSARQYFWTFAGAPAALAYFSPAATPLGARARALALSGRRVLCLVTKDANVVRYLTHDAAAQVDVVEYYGRPFDARDLSPVFRPQVILVERAPSLAAATPLLAHTRAVEPHERFDEIRLDGSLPLP